MNRIVRLTAIAAWLVSTGLGPPASAQQPDWSQFTSGRAFSLRVAQEVLQEGGSDPSRQRELNTLGGITLLQGYVLDPENRDVILFGKPDPALPELQLQDFLVAYRNADLQYAELRGTPATTRSPDARSTRTPRSCGNSIA